MAAGPCAWCARQHKPGPEFCLTGALLVCGGRHFDSAERAFAVLNRTAERVEITAVRHGGARGADSLAGLWATEHGYPEQVYPADWARLGAGAGPIRNQAMVDAHDPSVPSSRVVAVVAFPGGEGTADLVRRARAAGLPVWEVTA